jgi:hypothetical protein
MASKIARTGITRERGWLYFLDKKGDVSRARMARGGGKATKTKPQVVAKVGVKREDGFLYFIDKDGDVAKAKMAKPGSRRKSVRRTPKCAPRRAATRGTKTKTTRRARR